MKQQNQRGEQFFSKNTLDKSSAASLFTPPKLPGSNMGKSVLIYDGSSEQDGSNKKSNETVLNMDIMQKQQLQQRLMINEEVIFLFFNFLYWRSTKQSYKI